jgi:hypothetical protein
MHHKRVLPRAVLAAFATALTIAGAGAGPAAAAPADVADDIPNLVTPVLVETASTTSFPEVEAVVARGADDSVVISRRNPADNSYRPLFSVGGTILGDPAAVATNAGIEVFVRGTDNRIYANTVTSDDRGMGYSVVPGLLGTSDPEVVQLPAEPIGTSACSSAAPTARSGRTSAGRAHGRDGRPSAASSPARSVSPSPPSPASPPASAAASSSRRSSSWPEAPTSACTEP